MGYNNKMLNGTLIILSQKKEEVEKESFARKK